jgi:hypothetical protein
MVSIDDDGGGGRRDGTISEYAVVVWTAVLEVFPGETLYSASVGYFPNGPVIDGDR